MLRYYPSALFARRTALVPAGVVVPRLEGGIARVGIRPRHLARYREVCGFPDDGGLPIAYPHVLAMPLHLALLTDPAFVVRLMGLIHVANEIEWLRPLPAGGSYGLECWVEGHRETDRGHEFELFTELVESGAVAWRERCTLLARHRSSGTQAARNARAALRAPKPEGNEDVVEVPIHADHAIGRRYGFVSGDLNPIHIADFSARRFGFDRAVAHGMWSMARSLAALGPELTATACRVSVEFKMPLFLPSETRLSHWQAGDEWLFVLRDEAGQRPHLAGSVVRP